MADEIQAVLELDDSKWIASIQRAGAAMERFSNQVDQSFKEMDSAAKNPFSNLAAGINSLALDQVASKLNTIASTIGGALGAAGTAATDFEAEMRNVNSVAQLSEAEFSAFSDRIAGLGRELNLGVGPAEAAAGAYDIVSAGFVSAADSEAILREALRGSRAGITEVATASDLLTTAIASYGLTAQDAARVNDVLFQTVASGKTTYGELAQSFGQVSTIAAQNGVTLEELGASIALLTQRGLRTPEAINAVKAAIVQLGSPTEEAIKAQKAFGLNINQSTIRQKGFIAVLNEVTQATRGNTTAQRQILGDITALNAALGLTSDGGTRYTQVLGQMQNSAGATSAALEQQQRSLKQNLAEFGASLEQAGVAIGNLFLPALKTVVDVGTGAVDLFNRLPAPIQGAAGVTGVLAAGTVALGAALLGAVAGLASIVTTFATVTASATATSLAIGAFTTVAAGVVNVVLGVEAALYRMAAGIAGVTAGVAAFVAIAAAAGVALHIYTGIINDNTAAQEALLHVEERRAAALRKHADALGLTAEEYRKTGRDSKDLVDTIGGLMDQLEAARKAKNEPLVARLQEQIRDAQDLKKAVAGLEGAQTSAATSAITLNQTIAEQAAERKNALADEIQAITLSQQSDREKADSLQRLIGQYKLEGDERRRIEMDVARLRAAADKAEQQGIEASATATLRIQDAKIDGLKKELAAGLDVGKKLEDAIKRRTQLEIDGIRQRTQAALDQEADPTRRGQIQDQGRIAEQGARMKGQNALAETEKAADQEASERAKERTDQELARNKVAQDGISQRLEGLQQEAQRGRDNFAEQAKLIQQRADLEARAIKLRAEQEAKDAKDPGAKAAVLSNADAETANLRKQTERDLQDLQRDTADQRREQTGRELELSQKIRDAQIDALKQQAAAGKNVTSQLRAALLERLALQEEEIRLQAEAAKAATDSAEEQALIEKNAQAQIIQARIAARKEVDATTDSLEKQKAAQDSLSGVGDIQSFEDFLKGQSEQFGIGATRQRIAQQQAANRAGQSSTGKSGITTTAADLLQATGPSSTFRTPPIVQSVAQAAKTAAQTPITSPSRVPTTPAGGKPAGGGGVLGTVRVEVGVDPENGAIRIESTDTEVTANGRGSSFELVAGNLSPRANTGSF